VFSVDQVNFVLTVEKKSKSCGYEGGEYTFETIRILHRVCTDCKAGLFLKNGWYGPYDPVAKGQASYFAYVVQVRDGEYYHGDKKVQEKIPAIPPLLFAQLSEKWGIPKKIALDMHGNLAEEGFVI
jgi:hypothetical protein